MRVSTRLDARTNQRDAAATYAFAVSSNRSLARRESRDIETETADEARETRRAAHMDVFRSRPRQDGECAGRGQLSRSRAVDLIGKVLSFGYLFLAPAKKSYSGLPPHETQLQLQLQSPRTERYFDTARNEQT
ncbi:hypothetical protein PAGU2638_27830 [Lysobacter sp. PAGU 2638]